MEAQDANGYRILTQRSSASEIVSPIPPYCKPLAASVRLHGDGAAGLLASFYDPERHAWVVRQVPVSTGEPRHKPCCLIVRVITLIDHANLYELNVSLSTSVDGVDNDDLYALQRRSLLYRVFIHEYFAGLSGSTLRADIESKPLPQLAEVVTLAAPLEVLGGFVLTGGGFLSDYPVLRDGPALPRSFDAVYDDIIAGEAFCGPPMPPLGCRRADDAGSSGSTRFCCPGKASGQQEYTAWSVTAAANAGLTCMSIGLRRRSALEWAQLPQQGLNEVFAQSQDSSNLSRATAGGAPRRVCSATSDLLASAQPGQKSYYPTARSANDASTPCTAGEASRPLLETLTLRGEMTAKLSRKEGETWQLSLPPPHGTLAFAMGANRELMTVARKVFYTA